MDNEEFEPVPSQPEDPERAPDVDEEDDEGENLDDFVERDYRDMEEIDAYEEEGLDLNEVDEGSRGEQAAARRAAEEELDRRDRAEKQGRLPGALAEDSQGTDPDSRPRRRRRVEDSQAGDVEREGRAPVELGNLKGRIKEHLEVEAVRDEVAVRFKRMLLNFTDEEGLQIYRTRLYDLAKANQKSLFVDFRHLATVDETLAVWVADCPNQMLKIMSEAAQELLLSSFTEYERIQDVIYIRLTNLPIIDKLRDLRERNLDSLVRTEGVVTRRTGVFPQLRLISWDCMKCGYTTAPLAQNDAQEQRPNQCPQCQSRGPFSINTTETIYQNYQKITLQESPGTVPAGRLPRQKDVILLNDLIDCARPGDEIEVIGVYTHGYDVFLNLRNGFPVFTTYIEANCIFRREDKFAAASLTEEDQQACIKLSADPNIAGRIFKSIAPSIYGHHFIKKALALALFGGVEKRPSAVHRIRGDINALLLGDPGTAKSQFLKYIEKTASRAVYTTGKGASAVGLTASVHKDPITKEWTLEGGALVLADSGVCLIDEFDKMNDQDRVSIHEAMEQQSISISKAGIVTQLQARCSVLAAANPIGGRYDTTLNFAENVELSDPILSRFDVLCVVRDVVDPANDQRLAEFVVDNHIFAHPERENLDPSDSNAGAPPQKSDPDIIDQDMLRKYITFARSTIKPVWSEDHHTKIAEVYADLRARAQRAHGMPIAVRHLESMIRMSEAHARIHHRDRIEDVDVDMAVSMMVESFISTQKFSVHRELRRQFRRYLATPGELHPLLLNILSALVREELQSRHVLQLPNATSQEFAIPCQSLEERAKEYGITDLAPFYESTLFQQNGYRLDVARMAICHG